MWAKKQTNFPNTGFVESKGRNKERRGKVARTLQPLYFMRIVSVLTLNCLRCDLSQVLGQFSVLKKMIM